VFTPQIIVDGRNAVVGNDGEQVRNAIASAADRSHLPIGMTAQAAAGRARLAIALPAAPAGAETILPLAALTQSGLSSVVTRGENGGRTLRHGSVVRTIKRLDALKGAASNASVEMSLDRGWGADGFEAVVWLQGVSSRQVYGAAIASLGK
jgi:hypothetical protein